MSFIRGGGATRSACPPARSESSRTPTGLPAAVVIGIALVVYVAGRAPDGASGPLKVLGITLAILLLLGSSPALPTDQVAAKDQVAAT
jgi:hypothetical protein